MKKYVFIILIFLSPQLFAQLPYTLGKTAIDPLLLQTGNAGLQSSIAAAESAASRLLKASGGYAVDALVAESQALINAAKITAGELATSEAALLNATRISQTGTVLSKIVDAAKAASPWLGVALFTHASDLGGIEAQLYDMKTGLPTSVDALNAMGANPSFLVNWSPLSQAETERRKNQMAYYDDPNSIRISNAVRFYSSNVLRLGGDSYSFSNRDNSYRMSTDINEVVEFYLSAFPYFYQHEWTPLASTTATLLSHTLSRRSASSFNLSISYHIVDYNINGDLVEDADKLVYITISMSLNPEAPECPTGTNSFSNSFITTYSFDTNDSQCLPDYSQDETFPLYSGWQYYPHYEVWADDLKLHPHPYRVGNETYNETASLSADLDTVSFSIPDSVTGTDIRYDVKVDHDLELLHVSETLDNVELSRSDDSVSKVAVQTDYVAPLPDNSPNIYDQENTEIIMSYGTSDFNTINPATDSIAERTYGSPHTLVEQFEIVDIVDYTDSATDGNTGTDTGTDTGAVGSNCGNNIPCNVKLTNPEDITLNLPETPLEVTFSPDTPPLEVKLPETPLQVDFGEVPADEPLPDAPTEDDFKGLFADLFDSGFTGSGIFQDSPNCPPIVYDLSGIPAGTGDFDYNAAFRNQYTITGHCEVLADTGIDAFLHAVFLAGFFIMSIWIILEA